MNEVEFQKIKNQLNISPDSSLKDVEECVENILKNTVWDNRFLENLTPQQLQEYEDAVFNVSMVVYDGDIGRYVANVLSEESIPKDIARDIIMEKYERWLASQ